MMLNYPKYLPNLLRGYLLKKPQCTPLKISFEITYRCNSRCRICSRWQESTKKQKRELSTREVKAFFVEITDLKIPGVSLSGGEPLLRKDILEISKYAKQEQGIKFLSISTNGLLLKNAKMRKLLLDYYDRIHISLDGLEKTHDQIRGIPGTFQTVIKATRRLIQEREARKRKNPKILFNYTVSEENYQDIVQVAALAQKIGVDYLTFQPVHDLEMAKLKTQDKGVHKIAILKKEINQVIRKFPQLLPNTPEYYQKISTFFANPQALQKIKCWAGALWLRVNPYGDVYLCLSLPAVGNLRQKSLLEIMRSAELKKQIQRIQKGNHPVCWMGCYAPLNLAIKNLRRPWLVLRHLHKYQK